MAWSLNELIDELKKLQNQGHGDKICIFDDAYNFNVVKIDEDVNGNEIVSIY